MWFYWELWKDGCLSDRWWRQDKVGGGLALLCWVGRSGTPILTWESLLVVWNYFTFVPSFRCCLSSKHIKHFKGSLREHLAKLLLPTAVSLTFTIVLKGQGDDLAPQNVFSVSVEKGLSSSLEICMTCFSKKLESLTFQLNTKLFWSISM